MDIAATLHDLARESQRGFPVLHRLLPPYTELEPWPWTRPDAVPSDWIAVVRLEGTGLPPVRVRHFLRSFRRVYPSVPVVLALPEGSGPARALEEAALRGEDGWESRAVVRMPVEVSELRDSLTRFSPVSLRRWLLSTHPPSSPEDVGVAWSLSRWIGEREGIDYEDLSVRRALRRRAWPPPVRWKMLSRALPAAMHLQRYGCTVAEAAFRNDYPEPRSFRRHTRKLFRLPPSTVALQCGWEPLLARFFASS